MAELVEIIPLGDSTTTSFDVNITTDELKNAVIEYKIGIDEI